jgi:adaptin ear-binding coat-associated protein 1/2
MTSIDHSTGVPLPPDAIQRILFLSPSVHVYNIPPLTSTKGYVAATWTENNNKRQIFTARIRILETAIPNPTSSNEDGETVKTDILLEDPKTGDLFAAAPYTDPGVVEQVLDSSRFFAVRVQGEGGRKAVLGVGFEERSEAFDFSVSLQEVRRTLGLESGAPANTKSAGKGKGLGEAKEEVKRDFSLKEGETITVNIGGRGAGRRNRESSESQRKTVGGFSLPPPPGGGGFLPPPPSAQEVRAKKRLSQNIEVPKKEESIEDLGFDDGEFGEFQ